MRRIKWTVLWLRPVCWQIRYHRISVDDSRGGVQLRYLKIDALLTLECSCTPLAGSLAEIVAIYCENVIANFQAENRVLFWNRWNRSKNNKQSVRCDICYIWPVGFIFHQFQLKWTNRSLGKNWSIPYAANETVKLYTFLRLDGPTK